MAKLPWDKLRRFPCPKCGKKMLKIADHQHAFGHKDYSRVNCRGCGTTWKAEGIERRMNETAKEDPRP